MEFFLTILYQITQTSYFTAAKTKGIWKHLKLQVSLKNYKV